MKSLLLVFLLYLIAPSPLAAEGIVYRLFATSKAVVEKEEIKVKANRLLIVTEPSWCIPCRQLEPHLQQLKKEGYDVHTYTLAQWNKANPKPTDLPKVDEETGRFLVPTVMYVVVGEKINKVVKSHKGGKKVTADFIKQFLIKPSGARLSTAQ